MGAFMVHCNKECTKHGLTLRVNLQFFMTSNTSVSEEGMLAGEAVIPRRSLVTGALFML